MRKGFPDIESTFALCKAAPLLQDQDAAFLLLEQLSSRLSEAALQGFVPSPWLRSITPSPLEAWSFQITSAVLTLGLKFPEIRQNVVRSVFEYLSPVSSISNAVSRLQTATDEAIELDVRQKLDVASVSVSLIGFLRATAQLCDFFDPEERLDLVRQLHSILTGRFKVVVEGVFSTIRTTGHSSKALTHWKAQARRYAASGRPLGAMLIESEFMRVLVSSSSLSVCTPQQLRETDVFDILLSQDDANCDEDHDANAALIELQCEIATETMRLLEDGSDYLQLGSAWQQRLAFAAKSYSLQTFLNCMVSDEGIADSEIIMSWLEDAMADPVQMADEALALVVLQSMAVVAKFSPSIASTLSRTLPRFIVQSGVKGDTIVVAARCLSHVLRSLSHDAVITGLYSLGNVLSARSGADRASAPVEIPNGNAHTRNPGQYSQHSTGSAISLDLSGEEETAAAYGNVVRAIVTVAKSCHDDKITALAQTMLLQKLGKISLAVDVSIITEAAHLSLSGGPTEFKALLKLYARLGHEGMIRDNTTLLSSVSIQF